MHETIVHLHIMYWHRIMGISQSPNSSGHGKLFPSLITFSTSFVGINIWGSSTLTCIQQFVVRIRVSERCLDFYQKRNSRIQRVRGFIETEVDAT